MKSGSERPKVTVLMAVRNGARHLEVQLQSIADQTGVDWRLVAQDDGSSDTSVQLLQGFAARYPGRVRVERGLSRGATMNFLSLLMRTSADDGFLAFADQDDQWFAAKLERATRAIGADTGPALWCARVRLGDEDLNVFAEGQPLPRHLDFGLVLVESLAGGNTMVLSAAAGSLLRRALALSDARAVAHVYHDWWAAQVIAGAGGRLICDAEPCLIYRQHASALVGHGGRFRRADRAASGKFGAALRRQVLAISALQSLLVPENWRLLNSLRLALDKGAALSHLRLPVRRRGAIATSALRLLLALGRV